MSSVITGILLLNLGTPSGPTPKAVRAYLKEFLSDPFVIDLPKALRWCLLYGFILPFRPKSSSHAYQKIWTSEGSPLLVYSKRFKDALSAELSENYKVALGMRYGAPSIANAVRELVSKRCQRIIVIPLFPQYSVAATGSALFAAQQELNRYSGDFAVKILPSFYQDPRYHHAFAATVKQELELFNPDYVLFSYHGLPVRQLTKAGCDPAACGRLASCLTQTAKIDVCYRAQCFATTRYLAQQLSLQESQYQTTFQSRLGRTAWIQPYTDAVLPNLVAEGVKRLFIICPSFVADCLETLEEIAIRLREQWLACGGEAFQVGPCLNANPYWVSAFAEMVMDQ